VIVRFNKALNILVLISGKKVAGCPSQPLEKNACDSKTTITKILVIFFTNLLLIIVEFVLLIIST